MILRLVWRSMIFTPGRTLLMFGGYALGVGVMVALLSIGDAMVEQSRDRNLVGGGDLAILPAGIDLETLRTGGVSSLYFGIDLAPYYYREVLTGPRLRASVAAVAPWVDDELLYAEVGGSVFPISGGGQIPSLSRRLGVEPRILAGTWEDGRVDDRWAEPGPQEILSEIDAFHSPPDQVAEDSTWAEWHYFNLVAPGGEKWLYLTYLAGGDLASGGGGGQVLATVVEPSGTRVFRIDVARDSVVVVPGQVDVSVGAGNSVELRDGVYLLDARIPALDARGSLELRFRVEPSEGYYLPALDVSPGDFPSGYVVPVLRGDAFGTVCIDGRCEEWDGAQAYHDHNWGVWSGVTWDWGQFRLGEWSILYGGVGRDSTQGAPASSPGSRFLFAFDGAGLAAVLPVRTISYEGDAGGPTTMRLEAGRQGLRLVLSATVAHRRATAAGPDGTPRRTFFQMRGPARLEGELAGGPVVADGTGSFETWTRGGPGDGLVE